MRGSRFFQAGPPFTHMTHLQALALAQRGGEVLPGGGELGSDSCRRLALPFLLLQDLHERFVFLVELLLKRGSDLRGLARQGHDGRRRGRRLLLRCI